MTDPDAVLRNRRLAMVQKLIDELRLEDSDEVLDEAVHEAASEMATEVNNGGFHAQLDYLLSSGWKPEDILGRVKQAREEPRCSASGWMVVRYEVAEEMQRLLDAPEPTWTKDIPFDQEYTFADGWRMAIQVCPSGVDPTIVEGEGGEPHWTQGVLFSPEGNEMGCTEPGDTFLGEYVVEHDGVTYTVLVKQETEWPEHWQVEHEKVHMLRIFAPMEERDRVLQWVHDRGGHTTRSGPASTSNFPKMDTTRCEMHAQIPFPEGS